jgi:hypothetical protein
VSENDDIEFDYGVPADPALFAKWLEAQPAEVQEAARLFPLAKTIHIRDITYWVVGYTPEGALVCIKRDPALLDPETFQRLVEACDLLDPKAIVDIATKH